MITKINRIYKKVTVGAISFLLPLSTFLLTSCSDMLETESELVEFEKENTLDHPTDSVYSVMGIINKMQLIADRTVLLGEVRADLVTTTEAANADLKRLASFNLSEPNKYNQVSDYYAVINNCNYYLAHVDTTLQRRGRTLFAYEYAAVKAFRAWAYLELVKNYGEVPLVTEPVMTEQAAREAMNQQRTGIKDICDYFISDLTPYARVNLPQYGTIGYWDSEQFFIPMRALIGDLCLWAGRYQEAARWYHDYLNDKDNPIQMNSNNRVRWTSIADFQRPQDSYSVSGAREALSFIPMEARVFDGNVSDLRNIYASTEANNYYFQLTPSEGMCQLSAAQIYCIEYQTDQRTDTVYAPREGLIDKALIGDLRLYSNHRQTSLGGQNDYSEYSTLYQSCYKIFNDVVITYRRTMVYLRYAEALNRAGYPSSAMAVLKYGMCNENVREYVDTLEQVAAGSLITFDENIFRRDNTIGVHSIGSGDSQCNASYVLPQPDGALASRQDTINWQIPRVETLIVNEMALEGAFEGYRFYDLLRVALRRGDPKYLAEPISCRNGKKDETIYQLLMDQKNWFLPLP